MYYELKTSRVSAEALLDYLYETRLRSLKSLYLYRDDDQDALTSIHEGFVQDSFIYSALLASWESAKSLGLDDVEVLLSYMDLDLYKKRIGHYKDRCWNLMSDMMHMGLDNFNEKVLYGHLVTVLDGLNNAEEIEGITIEDFELNN